MAHLQLIVNSSQESVDERGWFWIDIWIPLPEDLEQMSHQENADRSSLASLNGSEGAKAIHETGTGLEK